MMRYLIALLGVPLVVLVCGPTSGQDTGPATRSATAATPSAGRQSEIYKAAKSAVAEARNRAARRDVSVRKRAMALATDEALKSVATRFAIPRDELDRIIAAGELADGSAARKAEASSKLAAKARVGGQHEALVAPPQPTIFEGVSPEQYGVAVRAITGRGANAGRPAGPRPGPVEVGESGVLDAKGEPGVWMASEATDLAEMVAAQAAIDKPNRAAGAGAARHRLAAANRIRIYESGSPVKVLRSTPDWIQVEVTGGDDQGRTGWVSREFVRRR